MWQYADYDTKEIHLNLYYPDRIEKYVGYGEIDPERILGVINDEVGDLFPGFEVDGGVYHGDEKCYITVRKGDDVLRFDLKFDI